MSLNLLDLNNDCLLEIFTKLTVFELAEVVFTCTQFRTLARDVFSRRHKSNGLKINVECCMMTGVYHAGRQQTVPILRNFGDLITNMEVDFWYDYESDQNRETEELCNTFIFNLMSKYCTGQPERIQLRWWQTLQPDKIIDATALFRNVKELTLHHSPAMNASFLSDAKQLTQLQLYGIFFAVAEPFLANDYPQLQSLSLQVNPGGDHNENDIVPFLMRHPNLFDLRLFGGKYDLSSIGECQSLRKLSIRIRGCDYLPVSQLENLTTLALTDHESLLGMLQSSKSSETLEEFMVVDVRYDVKELAAALQRFTILTRFTFMADGDLDDYHLSEIPRLKKLRVLSIGGDKMSITSDGLVDLVRRLPDLEKLCLDPEASEYIVQLKELTYLRLCEIYCARNKKLVISSCDVVGHYAQEEPFAGYGNREFVQYITFSDDYDEIWIVEI